jgi:hypothetical protein
VRTGSHGSAGRLGRRRLGVDAGIDGGSRGGDGTMRRRLGRQPERAEQAPHGVGLGHLSLLGSLAALLGSRRMVARRVRGTRVVPHLSSTAWAEEYAI